jgi:hypothetical protein
MEPDSLSWRLHGRLIVAAAILTALCWGGLIYWRADQLHLPQSPAIVLFTPQPM